MLKILKLCFAFYRTIFVANLAVTLGALYLILNNGLSIFTVVFWFKILFSGFTLFAYHTYKKNEYFFYLNLSATKKQLWIFSAVSDLLVFFLLFIVTLKIR